MTSSDIAIPAVLLEQLTGSGREITELADTASFRNPEWYSGIRAVAARKLLLGQIAGLIEVHGHPTAETGQVMLMAGPPGAGKSTVRPVVESVLGIGSDTLRSIDPDQIKDELLVSMIRDGSFHQWLVPPSVKTLTSDGSLFHPREFAALVHKESSRIGHSLVERAVREKVALALDATLSDPRKASQRISTLHEAGYDVTIVDVRCSLDQSMQRVRGRWEQGRRTALAADADRNAAWNDRLGGRWVPSAVVAGMFRDPVTPVPHVVATQLFADLPIHRLVRFNLPAGEAVPRLESVHTRTERGFLAQSGEQAETGVGGRIVTVPPGVATEARIAGGTPKSAGQRLAPPGRFGPGRSGNRGRGTGLSR